MRVSALSGHQVLFVMTHDKSDSVRMDPHINPSNILPHFVQYPTCSCSDLVMVTRLLVRTRSRWHAEAHRPHLHCRTESTDTQGKCSRKGAEVRTSSMTASRNRVLFLLEPELKCLCVLRQNRSCPLSSTCSVHALLGILICNLISTKIGLSCGCPSTVGRIDVWMVSILTRTSRYRRFGKSGPDRKSWIILVSTLVLPSNDAD